MEIMKYAEFISAARPALLINSVTRPGAGLPRRRLFVHTHARAHAVQSVIGENGMQITRVRHSSDVAENSVGGVA